MVTMNGGTKKRPTLLFGPFLTDGKQQLCRSADSTVAVVAQLLLFLRQAQPALGSPRAMV